MIFPGRDTFAAFGLPVAFAQYSCIERILTMEARGSGSRLAGVAGDGAMIARVGTVVGIGNERPPSTPGGCR
jgi:hypothetical protein